MTILMHLKPTDTIYAKHVHSQTATSKLPLSQAMLYRMYQEALNFTERMYQGAPVACLMWLKWQKPIFSQPLQLVAGAQA